LVSYEKLHERVTMRESITVSWRTVYLSWINHGKNSIQGSVNFKLRSHYSIENSNVDKLSKRNDFSKIRNMNSNSNDVDIINTACPYPPKTFCYCKRKHFIWLSKSEKVFFVINTERIWGSEVKNRQNFSRNFSSLKVGRPGKAC